MEYAVGRVRVLRRSVRVPQIIPKSVAFLAYRFSSDGMADNIDPDATVFYLGYPSTVNPAHHSFYFVGAKHSVTEQHGGQQGFDINTWNAGRVFVPRKDKWYTHPTDESVDVAITPFEHDPTLDIHYVCPRQFIPRDWMKTYPDGAFGIGSEVFFPGLFSFATGDRNAIPLVRFGNIAMLPEGPIQVYSGSATVLLIEARSIGGISGSPVFIRPTMQLECTDLGGNKITALATGDLYSFVGMVGGHYDIEGDINKAKLVSLGKTGVNMGIAVVIPAFKIMEVLEHPELVAQRTAYDDRLRAAMSPKADGR